MKVVASRSLRQELNYHISQIRTLMLQMDIPERLNFLNELVVSLMPERKSPESSADKLERKKRTPSSADPSPAQMQLLEKIAKATDQLSDFPGDDRA